ncbi:MAG: bifunctional histidinol-phosphatase/imidazoleglycerol-phosphate dehydratase HisB [Rikenellaceae bacterium]
MKKALFIDRDGTIIKEPPVDFQVDTLEKLEFCKGAITALRMISALDFELVMVSNQDGRGTESFPEEDFLLPQNKMLSILEGEGVTFDEIFIDDSFEEDNSENRKPRTGMLTKYLTGEYDLANSYVIGDRLTDVELAKNLGSQAILFRPLEEGKQMLATKEGFSEISALESDDWFEIFEFLRFGSRVATINRATKETDIALTIDLDGKGSSSIKSGLNFFDHMLDQIVHHGGFTVNLEAKGDLQVDEHHTIEDIGIVFGKAFKQALGDRISIERYGFVLPMDECDAFVTIDLGGRFDYTWDVEFTREMIGDVPTEMFEHFFKSFAQNAEVNLHIVAKGKNEHHKIEGVFKAFARALKCASKRDIFKYSLPSSKGVL